MKISTTVRIDLVQDVLCCGYFWLDGVIRLFGGICEMQEILQEDLPKELLDLFEEGRLANGCRPVLDLFSRLNHYLDF